jgi:hypothetical protein
VGGPGFYLLSARRGYLDLLNRLMNNEFSLEPSYYDVLGKVEYDLDDKHTMSVHGFVANDTYGLSENVLEINQSTNVDSVDSAYGNAYGWLTLKSTFSPQLYGRTIIYGGSVTKKRDWRNFDLDPAAHFRSATIHDRVDLSLIGVKQDWDYWYRDYVGIAADLFGGGPKPEAAGPVLISAEGSERATYYQDRGVFRGSQVPSYQRIDLRINPRLKDTIRSVRSCQIPNSRSGARRALRGRLQHPLRQGGNRPFGRRPHPVPGPGARTKSGRL